MEVPIVEKSPVSPTGDDETGEGKDDDKPRGTYALADMDKATFDEVRAWIDVEEVEQAPRRQQRKRHLKMNSFSTSATNVAIWLANLPL